MWGIFSSRISAASLLSGSILCNRTNHSKTLSLTSSTVKAESPCCALWILLNSFISRRKPMSLSQMDLHSLLSCTSKAWFEILRLYQDIQSNYRTINKEVILSCLSIKEKVVYIFLWFFSNGTNRELHAPLWASLLWRNNCDRHEWNLDFPISVHPLEWRHLDGDGDLEVFSMVNWSSYWLPPVRLSYRKTERASE